MVAVEALNSMAESLAHERKLATAHVKIEDVQALAFVS